MAEKDRLTKNIAQTAARLKRASKLTTALGDEQGRWTNNVAVCISLLSFICLFIIGGIIHQCLPESLRLVSKNFEVGRQTFEFQQYYWKYCNVNSTHVPLLLVKVLRYLGSLWSVSNLMKRHLKVFSHIWYLWDFENVVLCDDSIDYNDVKTLSVMSFCSYSSEVLSGWTFIILRLAFFQGGIPWGSPPLRDSPRNLVLKQ